MIHQAMEAASRAETERIAKNAIQDIEQLIASNGWKSMVAFYELRMREAEQQLKLAKTADEALKWSTMYFAFKDVIGIADRKREEFRKILEDLAKP